MTIEINEAAAAARRRHILLPSRASRRRASASAPARLRRDGKDLRRVDVTREPIRCCRPSTTIWRRADHLHGEVVTLRDDNPESVFPGLMAIGEPACVSVHGTNRLVQLAPRHRRVWRAGAFRVSRRSAPESATPLFPRKRPSARSPGWTGSDGRRRHRAGQSASPCSGPCSVTAQSPRRPLAGGGLGQARRGSSNPCAPTRHHRRSMIFNTDLAPPEAIELATCSPGSVSLHSAIGGRKAAAHMREKTFQAA